MQESRIGSMPKNHAFIDLLITEEVISRDASERLLRIHRDDAFAILAHLIRANAHQKNTLARLWGDSIGVAYVDLAKTLFQSEVVALLPQEFARKHRIIFLYQFGDNVTAAVADPANLLMLREAEKLSGLAVSPVFSLPEDVEAAIDLEYQSAARLQALSSKIVTDSLIIEDITDLTREELTKVAGTQGVVEFVKGVLLLAVRERASDIHIEPGEEKVRLRFRIDGVLQERGKLEKSLLPPIVSRLKIMADLDITEKRRPQDGRITLTLPNRVIDFRFSSVPVIYGEKVVLRILSDSQSREIPDLADLNFTKANMELIMRVADAPYGIFFVTGPTGSGKTTTLFAMLKHLNKPGVNITTIEDPVEYRMSGVNQVQQNLATDLDFPAALRSFLRQDPDVILVGEIRDTETAEIACRAALTGHLVLATLHANNAIQASTRLMDMGVEPHIVAPSAIGILSQRLVRRICQNCKESYVLSPREIRRIFSSDMEGVSLFRGKGCQQCHGSGYFGRLPLHEMVYVTDEIRIQLVRGGSTAEIYRAALQSGFKNMRYDGLKKALRGLTTIEELDRVTVADEELGGF
jgi:type IV pilus assembly protein PilB